MKIEDILPESVIDFSQFKKAKQSKLKTEKPIQTQANLSQHDNTLSKVNDHLDLLLDYIQDVKSSIRLPHFRHLDDIFNYINTTLRYPFNNNAYDWYDALESKDQSMVSMIAHYSPRLLKVLNTMEEKVNDFIRSVPKTIKVPDMVRYIQSNIQHDKSVLKELDRLIR